MNVLGRDFYEMAKRWQTMISLPTFSRYHSISFPAFPSFCHREELFIRSMASFLSQPLFSLGLQNRVPVHFLCVKGKILWDLLYQIKRPGLYLTEEAPSSWTVCSSLKATRFKVPDLDPDPPVDTMDGCLAGVVC